MEFLQNLDIDADGIQIVKTQFGITPAFIYQMPSALRERFLITLTWHQHNPRPESREYLRDIILEAQGILKE